MAKPLEPAVKGVNTWQWRTPVAADDKLAVLCDGDKRLIVIDIGKDKDAEKALTEAAAVTTKNSLVSPVAVLGKIVFVVARDAVDSTDSLLSFGLPNLTPGKSQSLGSHCVWGPQRVGNLVLVATEKNGLLAIGEQQQVVWQSALGYGPLAGTPYLSGDDIFLSARSGIVWRISASRRQRAWQGGRRLPLGHRSPGCRLASDCRRPRGELAGSEEAVVSFGVRSFITALFCRGAALCWLLLQQRSDAGDRLSRGKAFIRRSPAARLPHDPATAVRTWQAPR